MKIKTLHFKRSPPKIRIKLRNRKIERLISAFVTYTSFLLQIFLTDADIYWVANSPDIFALPLILRKENYILDYRSPWPLQIELEFGKGKLSRIAKYLTHMGLKHAKVITLTTSTLHFDSKKVYRYLQYCVNINLIEIDHIEENGFLPAKYYRLTERGNALIKLFKDIDTPIGR